MLPASVAHKGRRRSTWDRACAGAGCGVWVFDARWVLSNRTPRRDLTRLPLSCCSLSFRSRRHTLPGEIRHIITTHNGPCSNKPSAFEYKSNRRFEQKSFAPGPAPACPGTRTGRYTCTGSSRRTAPRRRCTRPCSVVFLWCFGCVSVVFCVQRAPRADRWCKKFRRESAQD